MHDLGQIASLLSLLVSSSVKCGFIKPISSTYCEDQTKLDHKPSSTVPGAQAGLVEVRAAAMIIAVRIQSGEGDVGSFCCCGFRDR